MESGESDWSGVIVYKWNEKNNRQTLEVPIVLTAEYGENAPPCQRGWHVSYDDGFTLYQSHLAQGERLEKRSVDNSFLIP